MRIVKTIRVLCCASLLLSHALAADLQPPTLPLGAAAPEFELPGVDGRNYTLKDFAQARILVVVFTAVHCPTAQYYEPRVKQFVADFRNRGVSVVAIMPNDPKSVRLDELGWSDLGDSFADMKTRARDAQYNYPYLYDGETETASRAYGPVATPHVFVFDAARKLRYVGAIDDSERVQFVKKHYLRDAVEALLADREPPVTRTKVVGCSVKWAGKSEAVREYMAKLAAEPVTLVAADEAALSALRKNESGKFRLVNFWATWCAPCIAEMSELVTINRMYRHRDFELVTVSLNRPDEQASVLELLKKKEVSCRNLIFASAERESLIDAFDPDWQGAVPYTVLLSPEGKVVYQQSGSIEPLPLKRAILNAMNERKPW
jgi:thiol-disulfide isomerase/thioredoxin